MSNPSCLLAAFLFAGLIAASDVMPPQVLFINAVGGPGRVFVELKGEDLNPSGHSAGVASGWLGVAPGRFELKSEHDPLGSAEANVDLSPGDRVVFALHCTTVPGRKEGRPPTKAVKLTKLSVAPLLRTTSNTRRLVLLSLSQKPEIKVKFDGKNLLLKSGQPLTCSTASAPLFASIESVTDKPEGDVGVEKIASVNLESPGVRLIVIFDGDDQQPLMATAVSLAD